MKLLMENWKKYLTEAEMDWDAFGFSDEERGESKGKSPELQTLLDLDRDDKFTIGNRKPTYRVTGTKDKGTMRKRIVIDGSAERKMYILKVVDKDTYDVAAFEVVGGGTDILDKPRGKSGAIQKIEQEISYSGIVLDDESKQKLLELPIPEGWEPVVHHMTITMGPLEHKKGKYNFKKTYPPGEEVSLEVNSVGMDDRAMAVKVDVPHEINSKSFPHVTVAVNREGGGKPFHSNKIPEENFTPIESPITLRGVVEEVPQ